jgi:transposase
MSPRPAVSTKSRVVSDADLPDYSTRETWMETMYPNCCGLDVHKDSVVACRISEQEKELRTFTTTTADLRNLVAWLKDDGCTHVAMESTGSYWKPVYNLLEDHFALVLVNARHLKLFPRRKTDKKDARWIADLLQHGLLRGSFVPSRDERELRELSRYETSLKSERTAEVNRIQKVLEGANIKLSSVASDVVGKSGRAMLEAILDGVDDPRVLAGLALGRLRKKQDALAEVLTGLVQPHQRFMLKQQLRHVDELDCHIEEVAAEIGARLAPFASDRERLETIPGVGERGSEIILCEVGANVDRFPTAQHFASWAGICPGSEESAGKNRSGRTPKGNRAVKVTMVQAAHAVGRTQTYLGAQYRRLKHRIGAKKAAVAVGHSILVIVYHVLRDQTDYHDLGPNYFEPRDRDRAARTHVKRLQHLGFDVTLTPTAA